ncbi:MAG: hypothetical protein N3D10_01645 [Candidatus Micrarchaeota archaeon]|nr:hypothetical protein [Candidatus Micrarchaeota archaeon]
MLRTHLKDKKRYLLYRLKIYKDQKITREEIEEIIFDFFGVYGIIENNLKVIYYDENEKYFILRCLAGKEKKICPFLSLISHHNGKPLRFELLLISGTIASLKRKTKLKNLKKNKEKG